jgi:sporulation protein YlmC with PRC-barrel domain
MKHALKTSIAIALLSATLPLTAIAQDSSATTTATQTQLGDVNAGALIGKNIVDGKGDTIGEIDSVMVNAGGKVDSVVVDVGTWLQGEKLIAVSWKDLKQNADGTITSSLTKEAAKAAADYKYADASQRGKVLTDNGDVYSGTGVSTGAIGLDIGTPVKNGDGSINTSQLIGLDVQNGAGEKVGDVGEIVLDQSGKVDGVIVDVGGFLGVGTHAVLLSWKDVTLAGTGDDVKAVVSVGKETLKAMPPYNAAKAD